MMKCIIIEDEANAQEVLKHYINQTSFLACEATFTSSTAVPSTLLSQLDFIFLDIELPVLNGLAFLRTLKDPPKVIITTAYPNFAVEAFEEAVIDYLVKPFSYERFLKAINRIKPLKNKSQDEFITVYADKITHKIRVGDIMFIKSDLDYVIMHTTSEELMFLDSLVKWEEKLKSYGFIRVHRSFVVNGQRVSKSQPGKLTIDNHQLPVGATYKEEVAKLFQKGSI